MNTTQKIERKKKSKYGMIDACSMRDEEEK
jgi:hypothetical protein